MTLCTLKNLASYDVMITREAHVGEAVLRIHYVPHKDVLDEASFAAYAASLDASQPLEVLAHEAFEACLNALVPYWLRLRLIKAGHVVMCEETAPDWANDTLINTVTQYDRV